MSFYYQALVRRTAELEIDIPDGTEDPLEAMDAAEVDRLHEEVLRADPLLDVVDDEETVGAHTVDLVILDTDECFSREVPSAPFVATDWDDEELVETTAVEPVQVTKTDPLVRLLDQLSASPVFAMSLGSKELFHSNLLAWLLETRGERFVPIFLRAVGIEAGPCQDVRVKREFHSFDLLLETDDLAVLVENKLKSVPRRAQLVEYAADADKALKGRSVRRVLLSPSAPLTFAQGADLVENGEWVHLSYARLADAVEELAQGESGNEAWLLREYARVVRLLLVLRDACSAERTALFLPGPRYEALKARRLHDLVYKWRYEEFAQAVEARLGERLYTGESIATDQGAEGKIAVSTAFTNGTALVDLKATFDGLGSENGNAAPLIGVQLQHDRLRIVAENVSARTAEGLLASSAAEEVIRMLGSDLNLEARPRGEKGLCHYGPWFHYRYVKVGQATLDEIVEAIVRAIDWMGSNMSYLTSGAQV